MLLLGKFGHVAQAALAATLLLTGSLTVNAQTQDASPPAAAPEQKPDTSRTPMAPDIKP